MKKLVLSMLGILFLMSFSLNINNSKSVLDDEIGISFNKMTLEEAKKEAKSTGKTIFIDCYTDWCGPCKIMARTAFKDAKVASLFNKKFINLKVEMEKMDDGKEIARAYGIRAYPTLLFIDSEGNLKKSAIGMQSASQLISLANSIK